MAILGRGMRLAARAVITLAVAGLAACGGGSNDGDNELRFRVIHAAPNLPPINVRLDGANFARKDYKDGVGFVFATPRTYDFEFQAVVPQGDPLPVFEQSLRFESQREYTLIAIGKAASADNLSGVQPLLIDNPMAPVPNGNFRLQAVHAAPDTAPLDLYVTAVPADSAALPYLDDEQPLFELSYGVQPEDRQLVTPGRHVIRLTPAGDPGTILFTSDELNFRNRDDVLFVVVTNTGTGPAPVSLVVTDDRGRALTQLWDRETTSALRVVNLSPDAPALDVTGIPATKTSFPDIPFTNGTNPVAVAVDAANGRALVADERAQAVLAIDLATGTRSVLSDNTTDTDIPFCAPVALALDTANDRVLVADKAKHAIFAVELSTGDRSVLSGSRVPDAANPLVAPTGIAVDGSRALVVDNDVNGPAILEVDLATGARTILSGKSKPDGTNLFIGPTAIAVDSANNRALVVDNRRGAVYAVDLVTGARSILSNVTTPDIQNPFGFPVAITLDSANNRALVLDSRERAVFAVDLVTGARTVLSRGTQDSEVPDSANPFSGPAGIALDAANGRALVIDSRLSALVAVALDDGARTVLSAGPDPAGVGYLGVTGYTGVLPDEYVLRVEKTEAPDPKSPLFSTAKVALGFGQQTTLYVIGLLSGAGGKTMSAVSSRDDIRPIVTEGKLRVMHGAPAPGAVDVYLLKAGETVDTANPVRKSQGLGSIVAHSGVLPGTYTIVFTKAGTKTEVAAQVLTVVAGSAQSAILVDAVRVDESSTGEPNSVLVLDDLAL